MIKLYLASGSPRRQQLLAQLGYDFDVVLPAVDETLRPGEPSTQLVTRLARAKAEAGLAMLSDSNEPRLVLGSDTIVVLDGIVLGKPKSGAEAYQMLSSLSNREHQVMTAVALATPTTIKDVLVQTRVQFCALSDEQIRRYLAVGEFVDKAGGYGIQGFGGNFVRSINGSYSSVVGLPLVETRELIESLGQSGMRSS